MDPDERFPSLYPLTKYNTPATVLVSMAVISRHVMSLA
ncbi:hypothetical protein FHS85_005013 [Rhodoligotrophos appendicifer]